MKKIIAILLVVVMAATMAIGGTMAYLTDRDSAANVFTVGDVSIELNEDFEQGANLLPGKDITKEPTIKNIGANDAWVWAKIAIPETLDAVNDASKNVVHFNFEKDYVTADKWTWTDENGAWMCEEHVDINGVFYNVYTVAYQTALKNGEETEPVMTKVYMDPHVDIDPNGDWYWVDGGKATALDWNSNADGSPIMYVSAYAVQAEGFDTVQDAMAAYDTQWGDNGDEWADVNYLTTKIGVEVKNPEDYTIDGLVVVDDTDESVNLRALYGVDAKQDVTITDSYLDGTYAMNFQKNASFVTSAKLTATNTTFKGWVSYASFVSAEFVDCNFGWNSENTYNYLRAYDPTTFTNCNFDGTTFDVADDGSLTFVNCTVNGVALTDASQLNLEDGVTVTIN